MVRRRPGGRLLPLAVIFVLLFTCAFFTGCGSDREQGDAGVTSEQSISVSDVSKDKPAKKEAKAEKKKTKDKKAEKDSSKEEESRENKTSKTKNTDSGNSSSDKKGSDKAKDGKKAERSSSDNNSTSGGSHKDKHKKKAKYCYFTVTCHTLTAIKDELPESLQKLVPDSGVIVRKTKVKLKGGESVFEITKKVLRNKHIHISYQGTTQYGTAYIEAINNIYEKDVNSRSGWIYKVNGATPGVGCSAYSVGKNDVIEWAYTCDLGEDL